MCRHKDNANAYSLAGDPHPFNCFVCEVAGELLNCRQCSRSYHKGCLDPPIDHSIPSDSWSCPACALLDSQGATHAYLLDGQGASGMARVEGLLDGASISLGHNDGPSSSDSLERESHRNTHPALVVQPKSTPTIVRRMKSAEGNSRAQSLGIDSEISVVNDPASHDKFGGNVLLGNYSSTSMFGFTIPHHWQPFNLLYM